VKRKIAKQHSKNEKQTTNKVLITCVQIITCYVYKMKHIVYQFLIHSSLCSTTLKITNFAIAEYKYITNQVSECQDPTEKKLCQFFSSVSETTRQRKRFTKSFSKQSDREKRFTTPFSPGPNIFNLFSVMYATYPQDSQMNWYSHVPKL
jgi:hypothetical protein